MTTGDNANLVKTSNQFNCEFCNYNTSRKYNLNLHLQSERHKNNTNNNDDNVILAKTIKKYECQNCSKIFNDRAGIWRHKKKCNKSEEQDTTKNETNFDKELIMMLIKQNAELMEIVKNGTPL